MEMICYIKKIEYGSLLQTGQMRFGHSASATLKAATAVFNFLCDVDTVSEKNLLLCSWKGAVQ